MFCLLGIEIPFGRIGEQAGHGLIQRGIQRLGPGRIGHCQHSQHARQSALLAHLQRRRIQPVGPRGADDLAHGLMPVAAIGLAGKAQTERHRGDAILRRAGGVAKGDGEGFRLAGFVQHGKVRGDACLEGEFGKQPPAHAVHRAEQRLLHGQSGFAPARRDQRRLHAQLQFRRRLAGESGGQQTGGRHAVVQHLALDVLGDAPGLAGAGPGGDDAERG